MLLHPATPHHATLYHAIPRHTTPKHTCAQAPAHLRSPSANLRVQDPAGFLDDLSNQEITMYREAELAHCRVSMIAALGFLVQENFHPIFPEIGGPASSTSCSRARTAKPSWRRCSSASG